MKKLLFVIAMCVFIFSCKDTKRRVLDKKSIEDMRSDGIASDTTFLFSVYGGIQLGMSKRDIDTLIKSTSSPYKGTQMHKTRKNVSNNIMYGARDAFLMSCGYKPYKETYVPQSDIDWFKGEIRNEPKELIIDRYSNLHSASIIVESKDDTYNPIKEEWDGWFTYRDEKDFVYYVICIFDMPSYKLFKYGSGALSSIEKGFVQLIDNKYGAHTMQDGAYYWIVGRYEVRLSACGYKDKYQKDAYEFIIEYTDNKVVYEMDLLKKRIERNYNDSIQKEEDCRQKELEAKQKKQKI